MDSAREDESKSNILNSGKTAALIPICIPYLAGPAGRAVPARSGGGQVYRHGGDGREGVAARSWSTSDKKRHIA